MKSPLGLPGACLVMLGCTTILDLDFQYDDGGAPPGGGGEPAGGSGRAGGSGGDGGSAGDAGGGGGTGGVGVGGAGGSDNGCHEDELDGTSCSFWETLNDDLVASNFEDGRLVLRTTGPYAWWDGGMGHLRYREVTGSFAVLARVSATAPFDDSIPPQGGQFQLGGIFARAGDGAAPDPDGEKWIKLEVGRRPNWLMNGQVPVDPIGTLAAVTWNDGSAHLRPYDERSMFEADLGICRTGSALFLLSKAPNDDTFVVQADGDHSLTNAGFIPLPDTLQVGVVAGSYNNNPDLAARIDFVRFADGVEVGNPQECAAALAALAEPSCACD